MPRAARKKEPAAIYHAMCRSITEFDLFPDNHDKEYFLDLLKKYKDKYNCKIYAYCLMTNHYHLHIDTWGFDISKFMQCLNLAYVRYINLKYNRKGHLFSERFNSKIIENDEQNLIVSAYIHNNPKDLPEYSETEFVYPYSSMGIYLGKFKDKRGLINTDYILGSINANDRVKALNSYIEIVKERNNTRVNVKLREYLEEFKNGQYSYKPYREILLRDKKPDEIIKYIADKLGVNDTAQLMRRWERNSISFRSTVAYVLTTLCGLSYKEACKYMHNLTASSCSRLSNRGYAGTLCDKAISRTIEELKAI